MTDKPSSPSVEQVFSDLQQRIAGWKSWRSHHRAVMDNPAAQDLHYAANGDIADLSAEIEFAEGIIELIQSLSQSAWVPASERPPSGQIVLAHYKNALGKDRIIRAAYYAKFTHESNFESDDLDSEYDESTDTSYWPEGWYEQIDNWAEYSAVKVSESHIIAEWQPLPPLPASKEQNNEA
jgi:hypothetical protein